MALDLAPSEQLQELYGIHIPFPINPLTTLTLKQETWGKDDDHRLYHSYDEHIKSHNLSLGELDERRAPRWAGLQHVYRYLHHKKHWFYPDGTELPKNEHQSFAVAVLLSANYLTRHAVDVGGRKPSTIELDDNVKETLQTPGVLHQQVDKHWAIGWFFGRYILRHGLPHILNSDELDMFMSENTLDPATRLRLGFSVINQAAGVVLDPIEPVYQTAQKDGRISPNLPKTALRFMMKHFDQRQPEYFAAIETLARAA